MLGGWPGALVAQWHLAHKTRKVGYQVVFWTIVAIHLALLVYLWTSKGPGAAKTPSPVSGSWRSR